MRYNRSENIAEAILQGHKSAALKRSLPIITRQPRPALKLTLYFMLLVVEYAIVYDLAKGLVH